MYRNLLLSFFVNRLDKIGYLLSGFLGPKTVLVFTAELKYNSPDICLCDFKGKTLN